MIKRSSATEDVFVLEMILHGRPARAIKAAFPLLQDRYLDDAIAYMMDDPDVKQRIDAGIIYYYREHLDDVEIPELRPVTMQERRDLLFKIITGKRKYPLFVRGDDGLSMVMAAPEPSMVNDALYMDGMLTEIEHTERSLRIQV